MSSTIDVVINGRRESLGDDVTAEKLIGLLRLTEQKIAVEINGEIVPRSTFPRRRIVPGDRIEIVRAVGGG